MSILDDAAKAVDGPRRSTYGHPRDNHTRTAALWSAFLGISLSARQVCMMNILQKVSRDAHGVAHRDTLVDIAGYARNAEMLEEPEVTAVDDEVSYRYPMKRQEEEL